MSAVADAWPVGKQIRPSENSLIAMIEVRHRQQRISEGRISGLASHGRFRRAILGISRAILP